MRKQSSSSKKGNCLTTSLIILAAMFLIPIIAGFGWIAGVIWLIFFRKKMDNDPVKQKKYIIGVSAASVLSLILFAYSLATPSAQPQSDTFSSIKAEDDSEHEIEVDGLTHILQPTESPTSEHTNTATPAGSSSPQPTATPTLQPTETPQSIVVAQPTVTPMPQATEAPQTLPPESQIGESSTTQKTEVSTSQSPESFSNNNTDSGTNENNTNASENSQQDSDKNTLVWIDDTAKRYHRENGCGMDNAYQVTLEEALQKGKTPCGRCYK